MLYTNILEYITKSKEKEEYRNDKRIVQKYKGI